MELGLLGPADLKGLRPGQQGTINTRQAPRLGHLGTVRGQAPGRSHSRVSRGHGPCREGSQCLELLHSKGQLGEQGSVQVPCLCRSVVGQVLQGGGGLHRDVGDAQGLELSQDSSTGREVVSVGAAGVDQSCTKALADREAVLADEGQGAVASCVTRHTTEVEGDCGHRQVDGPGVGGAKVVIVGDQVNGAANS